MAAWGVDMDSERELAQLVMDLLELGCGESGVRHDPGARAIAFDLGPAGKFGFEPRSRGRLFGAQEPRHPALRLRCSARTLLRLFTAPGEVSMGDGAVRWDGDLGALAALAKHGAPRGLLSTRVSLATGANA
jgi:hypothetical protein